MGRTSTVVELGPDKQREIDAAIARGVPASTLGRQFGVSEYAVRRYRMATAKKAVQKKPAINSPSDITRALTALAPAVNYGGFDAATELVNLYRQGQALLKEAHATGQLASAVGALGRLTKVLEVHSKLMGEMPTGPVHVEVTVNQVSSEVRNTIIDFSDAPPEVRQWAAQNLLNKPE